jgi:competence ComEA-like helix-hairpin-helix protein
MDGSNRVNCVSMTIFRCSGEIGTHRKPKRCSIRRSGGGADSQAPQKSGGVEAIMAQQQVTAGEAVDLNRASVEELILLIGISESIAEGIIDFRDANGGFDRVEDLMEVECISESWYQRIRPKLIV